MAQNRLFHKIERCKEEGFINSSRIVMMRIKKPLKKMWLRHKYLNYCSKPNVLACANPKIGKVRFFFSQEELPQLFDFYREHYPEQARATIEVADLICNHKFKWLCPNCPDFGDKIIWNDNFVDGRQWSLDFFQDLDYSSDQRLGDVRQVWELNRHQYLLTLAKAYQLTGHKQYADECISQILDWIDNNPVGYGINWLHSQEVALRAVAWTWTYQFIKSYSGCDNFFKDRFLPAIFDHALFIRHHLSDGLVTHNHLVTEACGLACLGIMYPEFKLSKQWRKKGIDLFFREVIKQIWADGLDAELATNYHCFVLDSFLQLYLLLLNNDIKVPANVTQRIEKMIEAVMYLLRPDGSLPLIGDCDGGRAFRLTEFKIMDRRAYLSIGAVIFSRQDFKKISGAFHEESFWFLGEKGRNYYDFLTEELPESQDKVFVSGGMASFRNSWESDADFLLIRGGPTKRREQVGISHNHADFLSFEFFAAGRKVFVDPGVYLYGEDDGLRFHYRKTSAHNTVLINGIDHINVTSTRFGVPGISLSKLHRYRCGEDWAVLDMEHSAYERFGFGHRRKFIWLKGTHLIIVDFISGINIHRVEQFFHLAVGLELDLQKRKATVTTETGKKFLNMFFLSTEIDGRLTHKFCGDIEKRQDWVSEGYARKESSNVLRVIFDGGMPLKLITILTQSEQVDMFTITDSITRYAEGDNECH